MVRCEHIDSKDEIAIPMIVEKLRITDQEAVHACLIHEHFSYLCALQVRWVVHNLLVVAQCRATLSEHFLGYELVLRGEDP